MGKKFRSSIKATIINGELICEDGKIISDKKGVAIEFDRVWLAWFSLI